MRGAFRVNIAGARVLRRFFITAIALISLACTAYAADTDWTAHIKVSVPYAGFDNGQFFNYLRAGVREDAKDGFDSPDTISWVKADNPLQAMFTHGAVPEDKNGDGMIDKWSCSAPDDGYDTYNCSLWGDIRSFDAGKVWPLVVASTVNGATVTIEWGFDNKPENIDILLVDLSNPANIIDMKNTSLYSYTNTNNIETGKKYGIRYFEIRMETRGLFITPPALPDATVDTPYNTRLSAVGSVPVWSLETGSIPPGMFMNTYTGEITGAPVAMGTYTFAVRGDDPVNGYSSSKEYTITINSIPQIGASILPDGIVGRDYNGQITASGGSEPLRWSITGNLPEGITLDNNTGMISGRLIVPGIYEFTATIKDANGAVDSADFRITVVEPEDKESPGAINDLRGIYISDSSVLLIWSAPSDDSMTGTAAIYDLRYLEGCPDTAELTDGTWDKAVPAGSEPRPQAGALQTYTLTGLKAGKTYCIAIKSMDAASHVSTMSNIVTLSSTSDSGTSGFTELTSSMILKRGYNLISLPLIPVPNVRDLLFGPVVGNPECNDSGHCDRVALYRWYSAYPDITPPQYYLEDIVMPGLGYFLYSPEDVSVDISGLKIEKPEYGVALQHGWNMIGAPYNKAILLRDIQVKNSAIDETKSYIDAVKAGWIGNTAYQLKSGNYDFASFNDDPPAALEPWVGYWIYVGAEKGVEVIIKNAK